MSRDHKKADDVGWMHIYAQHMWHDEVQIKGNHVALRTLRDAISKALGTNRATQTAVDVFVNDGEGYRVIITPMDHAVLQNERLPYTDEMANPDLYRGPKD